MWFFICCGASIQLNATGAGTYTWSPSTGLSATAGSTVTATPAISTKYFVTGSLNGCTASDSVLIFVVPAITPAIQISYTGCPSSSLLFTSSTNVPGSTIQWFVNNVLKSTGSSYTLANAVNGDKVFARSISANNCINPSVVNSEVTTINCITTGLPVIEALESINVSPNPSKGNYIISLKLRQRKKLGYEVYDATGRKILEIAPVYAEGNISRPIEISPGTKGMYLLVITVGTEKLTRHLVVN
jgi:hypothetical protein